MGPAQGGLAQIEKCKYCILDNIHGCMPVCCSCVVLFLCVVFTAHVSALVCVRLCRLHICVKLCCPFLVPKLTVAGLEPAIFASEDQRLIH